MTSTGSTRPIVRILPVAVVAGVVVAIVVAAFAGGGASTVGGRLGGDFPAFYAAGRMVIEGAGNELYDPAAQAAFQLPFYPESERPPAVAELQRSADPGSGGFLYFAYPPFTAIAYAALAILPYRLAFVAHGLLSVLALWGAVHLVRPLLPRALRNGRDELVAVAVLLATYPILRAVLGGQNTAFTLLLLAALWRFASDDRHALAGLSLAALAYKPQFGLLAVLLVVAARRWRILAWWALGAGIAYAMGAVLVGWGWPAEWLNQTGVFNDENLVVNGDLMVSAIGWFRGLFGIEPTWPIVVGLAVAAVVGLIAAVQWWRAGIGTGAIALGATAIVVGAPSALYYDAGLAVASAGVGVDRRWAGSTAALIGFVAVSWSQIAAGALGWSPLFPVLLVVFAWAARSILRQGETPAAP